jgi:hypothetical protein
MPTTLRVPASNTHSNTFTAKYAQASFVSRRVCLEGLYACAHFHGWTRVCSASVIDGLDILEFVHPQTQRAFPCGFAEIAIWSEQPISEVCRLTRGRCF